MNTDATYTVRLAGTRLRFLVWPARPVPRPSEDAPVEERTAELRRFLRHVVHVADRDKLETVLGRLGTIRLGLASAKVSHAWEAAMTKDVTA